MSFWKWLYPGLKVKRWLLVALLGCSLLGLGFALLENEDLWLIVVARTAALRESLGEGLVPASILILLTGILLVLSGFQRMIFSVLRVLLPETKKELIDTLLLKHQLKRGPKLVAIGGGTGLSTLLRGLKAYTSNITAIVTVTDDGGSSGRLRGEMGILPPGDIRNCLIALADTEPLMERLLEYRFPPGTELGGHSMGNLLLAGLTEISGDMDTAIQEIGKVLAVRGRVLPSTLDYVQLCAQMRDGKVVCGETSIVSYPRGIERIFLEPMDCKPMEEALAAIAEADAVILGPGSLYTSILPNLLVKELALKLYQARCPVYYVVNVMTQHGETDDFKASDHVQGLLDHGARVDYVVANVSGFSAKVRSSYREQASYPVRIDDKVLRAQGVRVIKGDFIDKSEFARHDQEALARVIMEHLLDQQPLGRVRHRWKSEH